MKRPPAIGAGELDQGGRVLKITLEVKSQYEAVALRALAEIFRAIERPAIEPAPAAAALLDEKAAAKVLGISFRTLQAWRVQGTGPRFCKVGRVVRYRPADLSQWMTKQVTAKTSGRRSKGRRR